MDKYVYQGPVMLFDCCVANNWKAETWAESKNKARSNLAYQFKRASNRPAVAKITLHGNVKRVD